ncbi:hypothetical protein SAMN05443144_102170 [Fodinibius roseus]|uniref:Uncharacterized protein n=1 Tax=Fodinibius roseus TaxID=1194090 RepID=A0A1M4V0N2_9BACT|nr:hypothetical protein SAMN05443144_102170 [Fodinibius roseus]
MNEKPGNRLPEAIDYFLYSKSFHYVMSCNLQVINDTI